ncbi:PP2C family protein-serine/threonine phosphatase [Glaciecola petra]|uniref:Protein phosphatase 2C domain-containing protein n=1 Tax=Glaciecola petra TaxID=3075602 RepID=A0ABU2ZT58_9ALTE|nr:protein phosphatase 2C domain-containing protein [Aestuariibacter sp. P117]MDT0595795.1 protein phosphatase 2C domain-containing protein [Aestuariibacter sp. P117]
MSMQINAVGISHTGKVRPSNEDCFLINKTIGLWIIADGMGGHDNGKIASKMACDIILQHVEQGRAIEQAIYGAHASILEYAIRVDTKRGMGTTLALAKLEETYLDVWWVGDSRVYLQEGEILKQLTHDHSKIQELLDLNLISKDQAITHPHRHIITRSLGMSSSKPFGADHKRIELTKQSKVLLCSDGLSNELNELDIQQILTNRKSLQEQAEQLIHLSNTKGGRDNTSVILLEPSG